MSSSVALTDFDEDDIPLLVDASKKSNIGKDSRSPHKRIPVTLLTGFLGIASMQDV
jgi:hypothetical protein